MRWICLFVLIVSLGGCGVAAMYAKPEVISGDADQVAVKTGVNINPGSAAKKHCARFSRDAVLQRGPIQVGNGYVYYFTCT